MNEPVGRMRFLVLAAVFEGGLVFVALGLGWLFHVDLASHLRPTIPIVALGLAGGVLPFLLLLVSERFKFGPLERIKEIVLQILGPALASCRWYDVVLAAALAGLGEEFLFRGILQPLLERWAGFGGWGRPLGLILSNVVFGLLHLITPT